MTGPYAANTGPGSVLGAQMAIEDFRGRIPSIKAELRSADLQLKPDVALAIAGDWFDNKGVDLLTDVPLSSAAIAMGEMAKAKDKLAIFTGAASAELTGQRCGPNHLHWVYDTWAMPHSVVDRRSEEGRRHLGLFVTADYAYGHSLAKERRRSSLRPAARCRPGALSVPGTTRFLAYLVQAKASGAKVIGLANGGEGLGELHQAGGRVRHHQRWARSPGCW